MCQKFIGKLKTFFNRCVTIIQHIAGCSVCKAWIKEHIKRHSREEDKNDGHSGKVLD